MAVRSYGRRIGIRVTDPAILDGVTRLLPPGAQPASSNTVDYLYSVVVGGAGNRPGLRRYHVIYSGSSRIIRTMDLEEALKRLELDIHYYVALQARRRIFVHAGAVGWQGQAIVIPGRSWSGKSTLVAALVREGATYYSDEFTVIDERGRVHPYPIALAMREGRGWKSTKRRVEEFCGLAGTRPLPLGLISLTSYKEDARWRPKRMTPGEATLALLHHTFPARTDPDRTLRVLSHAASRAIGLKGSRGEASDAAAAMLARATKLGLRNGSAA